jgi:hypothetical protein
VRIHPPTPDIPPDDPYANDLFGRKEFGASLFSLFKNLDESMVLCVDAPWGQGKTTFAKMWTADLRQRGANCIYFDAYEHDHSDDPFVAFCAEIIALAGDAFPKDEAVQSCKKSFTDKAKIVGGRLLSTAVRVGVKALTLGAAENSDIEDVVRLKADLAEAKTPAETIFGRELDDYVSGRRVLSEFRNKLSALGESVRKAQDGFPLLVVIDELDRCRPDFALALIERIKHLFSVPNVSFVLLVNMAQLESYVRVVYGQDVDARNYLHKFFSLYSRLPENQEDGPENDLFKYTGSLLAHYEIKMAMDVRTMVSLFQHYRFSLREMERCMGLLALYYSQLPERRFTDPWLVFFLAVIRIRKPDTFSDLHAGRLSFQDAAGVTGVNQIRDDGSYIMFPRDGFLNLLQFCLLTDAEFDALAEDAPARDCPRHLFRYRTDRRNAIPFLCSELERFRTEEQ